jgi:hypothetical protein
MRVKSLSTNNIRYKTLDRLDSKFMVRQVKNLRMKELSQTNSHYMEANIKGILQIEPYKGENYPTPRTY